jgi:hypothetical protein
VGIAIASMAGCSLFTSFDGFSGGDAGGAQDATGAQDADVDGDGGADSVAADVGSSDSAREDGSPSLEEAGSGCVPACSGATPVCNHGVCSASCPSGSLACSGTCIDPTTDNANCGACGVVCSLTEEQFCNVGQCGTYCSGVFTTSHAVCGKSSACVNLTSASADCSACGKDCSASMPGASCTNGVCACAAGYALSAGNCLPGGLVELPRVGWTASANVSSADGGEPPSNVLDGNLCTRFLTASQSPGDGLSIDMGVAMAFGSLVLDASQDSSDVPASFSVYVSNDGVTWGSAVASGTGNATTGVTTVTFPEQTARYIGVQLTAAASNPWAVDEVHVYSAHAPAGTPVPLSRAQWSVTASVNGTSAGLAIDGDLSTRYTTGAGAATGDWFEVNMGGPVTFDSLSMDPYSSCFDSARAFSVNVSDDGVSWRAALAQGSATTSFVKATFQPQTAQYVQVVLDQSFVQFWSIHEFNVYTSSH